MSDLAAFLKARLDDAEVLALAAGADDLARQWTADDNGYYEGGRVLDGHGEYVVYDEGAPDTAQALHIAANDPASRLRGVEAGRGHLSAYLDIVRMRAEFPSEPVIEAIYGERLEACRLDAGVWSDHPDYDPAWAGPPG